MPDTYYFDASDAAASDPNSLWTNDANAFDGNIIDYAEDTTGAYGTTASNFLMAEGTNAPTSGPNIFAVRARIFAAGDVIGSGYSPYTTLSVPSGGWTWQVINDLETKIYLTGAAGVNATIFTNGLAENLGTASYALGGSDIAGRAYKVEVEVSINDLISKNMYLVQGFQ